MLEIELVLTVYVGQVHVQKLALLLDFGVERSAGDRRVQHELVKIGFMRYGIFDFIANIFGCVMFQPYDAGPQ